MQLTYWYARCLDDSDAYSIREGTKKAALAKIEEYAAARFDPPVKVTVEYDSGLDLLQQCMGEGRGYWEVS